MFGVSLPELAVIFVILLLVFGPEKLPELAIRLGKLSGELKRASDGVRREFYNSVYKPANEQIVQADRNLRTLSITPLTKDQSTTTNSEPGQQVPSASLESDTPEGEKG